MTQAARLRATLSLATLVMLGLSWPLWVKTGTEPEAFPRVPFVFGPAALSASGSRAVFASLLLSIATAGAGIAWRRMLALSLALLLVLIAGDQHRFQPWVYQYLMVGLMLASQSPARGLRYARGWYLATYLHSGLSKLDGPFCREMGLLFLATAVRPLGVDPTDWPIGWRNAAVLAMPAGEIVVALALAWPRSRRLGLLGASALHVALIAILGPLGLRHSTILLVWNAAMLAEVWLAFGPVHGEPDPSPYPFPWLGRLARGLFWVAVVLPISERWGWLDAWPSHALYASHGERTEVWLHESELSAYPPEVRRHVRRVGDGPWHRLDLTGWSREVRGVPVYPQGRACNGLAEALAARYGEHRLIRVVQWSRTDPWTGQRRRVECQGREAIQRQGDRYRLNAHPFGTP